ncbi:MAG TPA: GspH/FimT family protein [Patescibacteria group bacterium]|nr:GspH/FimT family protein [Patescibacteria group bacterium]
MIVIAIVGIVVMIAVGNFRGLMEKYRVEGETKQMFADLMDARGRAMQRNRVFHVQITNNGYKTFEDTDPAPDGDTNLTGSDTQVVSENVRHTISPTGGLSDFRFNRNGIASVTGSIRFSSTTQPDYDCITVNATRIKMGQNNATDNACVEK